LSERVFRLTLPVFTPITQKLLAWFAAHRRDLPWRHTHTPYAVWVAEIMAQQTRLESMLPYYQRWMERFPTVFDLAAASQQDVLNLWEGLGYYSRARNLHKAAGIVIQEHNGELPSDVESLRSLPGIGRYTAGAIASLAFGLDEPAVDGNVKRVLARVFMVEEPVDSTLGEKRIWALASENLPPGQAGEYNQALMELGALICLPNAPDCSHCPVNEDCRAHAAGRQADLPVKKVKGKIPHYTVTAAVIRKDGRVLIAQRPQDEMFGGMWEFPGGGLEDGETLQTCLKREIKEELGVKIRVNEEIGVFKATYSHFRVTLHAFACALRGGRPRSLQVDDFRWVTLNELEDFPMGKLDRLISQQLQSMEEQHES
jgi:A/G-specific adenine glycosylase